MANKYFIQKVSNNARAVEEMMCKIAEKEAEIQQLRKEITALNDRSAGARDARAGIYDSWYRNHREDNSSYDIAWNIEKENMILEGYEDGWYVVEG